MNSLLKMHEYNIKSICHISKIITDNGKKKHFFQCNAYIKARFYAITCLNNANDDTSKYMHGRACWFGVIKIATKTTHVSQGNIAH
jgi:hypothetical protein